MAARAVKEGLQAAGAAFQLLTRIPIPVQIPFTSDVLAKSVLFYPLVGLVVGGITAAAGWAATFLLPAMPAAVLMLLLWIVLTGALHLDGLMDTADGVLSHRSRERMLEIMKDSRVGAMGVVAAIIILLLKFSVLAELPAAANVRDWMPHLIAACMWSRLWMVVSMLLWPNARGNEGMGGMFAGLQKRHLVYAALVQLLLLVALYSCFSYSFLAVVLSITIGGVVAFAIGSCMALWISRKLGGLTGDTYGAMNETVEALLLLVLAAVLNS